MTNWAALQDGYGDAGAVPAMIAALADAPTPEQWSDLWGHLCHQGTVYTASFAALPLIHDICPRLAPVDRRGALMLASAIMASTDRYNGAAPDEAALRLLPDLLRMTEAALGEPDVDDREFCYLLQAALGLRGDGLWYLLLANMAADEFQGVCRVCASPMFILPAKTGYTALARKRARNPDAPRTPVTPASPGSLPRVGAWLHAQAMQHKRQKAADAVTNMFGRVDCPECSASISVAEAVLRSSLPSSSDEDE